ncbi:hypothetical protein DICSQDRAFT_169131 [Dichomitus squalens LYAD-421 SS1]|uniref:uncharacterized protein n=1 Tax=Dichomitus squalens (strain LYAD-421) TaxID=732165 RepID=UPI00044154C3|nr:uncharacterized protein DICSQDRAFT_169131 [Dichomitus squalens LYAD-421 SS1]EJF62742.1 hypothetical protein DICSQDRAFT_169131 [Dichomitus squalens LYAD-421 SS1]
METLLCSPAHIDHSTFLQTFWPLPAADTPILRQNPAPTDHTDFGLTTVAHEVWLVDKLKLCSTHMLSIEPPVRDESLWGSYQWGHLQPLDDVRPAWALPQVLFLFTDGFPSQEACTQIIVKFEHQFTLQHLTALYMVVVHNDSLRLVRYDRSGTIVTPCTDFISDPMVLPDLFWRLSVLTDEQLGMDPTATPILPGSPEHAFMDDLARKRVETDIDWHDGAAVPDIADSPDPASAQQWSNARSWFRDSIHPKPDDLLLARDFTDDHPRWKLHVPAGADAPPHEFLVGAPIAFSPSVQLNTLDQRNPRVFAAYDCTTRQLVCLKDTWRTHKEERYWGRREGLVLEMLNKAGVPFVPTLVCEAELPGQVTQTQRFRDSEDGYGTPHILEVLAHYRVVTKEICVSLEEIKTSRQLVQIIGDCITGHAEAAKSCSILHGDISYSNIMICPIVDSTTDPGNPTVKWRGMLIDWELCRPVPTPENIWRVCFIDGGRSWGYVSVEYIRIGRKALKTPDELESFFYVLLEAAAYHLPSNLEDEQKFVDAFFSTSLQPGVSTHCGWGVSKWKLYALDQCRILRAPARDGSELRFYRRPRQDVEEDGTEPVDHAFNALLLEYLSWCHGVLRVNWRRLRRYPYDPPAGPNPAIDELDVDKLAAKLNDHDAVRELFASALKVWPEYPVDLALPAVQSEPGRPEDGEASSKAAALDGQAGGENERAPEESGVEVGGVKAQRMTKTQTKERRKQTNKTAERTEKKAGEAGANLGKPLPSELKIRVSIPVRSSRRIRGEPAPDPDEPPSKRSRL